MVNITFGICAVIITKQIIMKLMLCLLIMYTMYKVGCKMKENYMYIDTGFKYRDIYGYDNIDIFVRKYV